MTIARTALVATAPSADGTFVMREDEFRLLYDRTSRPLWVYLWRLTRDAHAADDLLQDTYYRFLRTPGRYESERHERNALYRIATNLVRDGLRRGHPVSEALPEDGAGGLAGASDAVHATADRTDVQRALARLRPRDRELLWLAYAEGSSHVEIAASLGLRTGSIKMLLSRARRRMADLLQRRVASPGEPVS
ncbi:MAG: RNA polymerase sigma factor [Luteitalea sp.]